MVFNRTNFFILISFSALLLVLGIQVSWIIQTAKIKEALFNEKANIILSKTTDALLLDKHSYSNLDDSIGKNEIKKIDMIFKKYMDFYNLHIEYVFEVKRHSDELVFKQFLSNQQMPSRPACYQKNIESAAHKSGIVLKLFFPNKKQFILAEMGGVFISSVTLIFIVLLLFWRTVLALRNEKKIAEHTTEFLNNMIHEFKTPLTNIALASKMIKNNLAINQQDKIKYYTSIIVEENEKLAIHVEQMLTITELERGEIPFSKTTLNINEIISHSIKCLELQIEDKFVDVTFEINAQSAMVNGDKLHLTHAVCNLIENSIKYAGSQPKLKIATYNQEKNIVIEIIDNGIGIAHENHKNIFDKYFRVPTGNLHNVKGFGIGLFYVKKIVELHNGIIEVKSEPKKETIFTIILPHV